jgi:hypothetical protein
VSHPSEELAELREASDVLLQQTTDARARLRPVQAQDSSSQILVRLDASGQLLAVQVGFTWDQKLTRHELPAAVLEALAEARGARLEQYGTAINDVTAEPTPQARPTATTSPVIARFEERLQARGGEPAAAAELVTELLTDAEVALGEANQLLDEHSGRQFTGRSAPGHVTATASGAGDLLGLDLDQDWLTGAHPASLGREITQAVLAAGERAQREGLAATLRASKLAQLAHLLTDQAIHA